MFTRGGTRTPFLRFFFDGDAGAGGGDNQNSEPAFPANTPVKDMTPEQQAAYWQDKARKHENRNKAFGDWTPEKIGALEQERDTLKSQGLTDSEKEKEAAREEGRAEVRAVLNRERVTTALQKALTGRVPDAAELVGLDVNKFIVNGQVDDTAVKAWVDAHSEEAPKGQQRVTDIGQGRRGSGGDGGVSKSVAAGRDLYAERHSKKSTTTS